MRVSSKLFSVVLIAAITAAATDTQALTKIELFVDVLDKRDDQARPISKMQVERLT